MLGLFKSLFWTFCLPGLLLLQLEQAFACTDFRIISQDKSVIVGRSLEFSQDLNCNVRTSPRGITFTNVAPDGTQGMSWKSKYGYVYIDALNAPVTMDGLNEKGLSFEYLFLPGETQYSQVPVGKNNQAIPYFRLGDWILGNFATLDEVKKELPNIYVYSQKLLEFGDEIFPVHAAIYDATGKGIVVEFIDGKMNIYNNELGVMTNSPGYDWHMVNIRNYLNLSPYNPVPVMFNKMTFISTGQGGGMLGLPGDVSPPSRFIKIAMLSASAVAAATAQEALNLAQHFMNTVDIPKGFVRAKKDEVEDWLEITQWAVFKDLTNKVIYYRTYNDMTIRSLPLGQLNLSENAPLLKMPMKGIPFIFDITEHFLQQTVQTPRAAGASSPAGQSGAAATSSTGASGSAATGAAATDSAGATGGEGARNAAGDTPASAAGSVGAAGAAAAEKTGAAAGSTGVTGGADAKSPASATSAGSTGAASPSAKPAGVTSGEGAKSTAGAGTEAPAAVQGAKPEE